MTDLRVLEFPKHQAQEPDTKLTAAGVRRRDLMLEKLDEVRDRISRGEILSMGICFVDREHEARNLFVIAAGHWANLYTSVSALQARIMEEIRRG